MLSYTIKNMGCSLQVYECGNQHSDISILFLHGGPGSGAKAIMNLSAFKQLEKDYHCIYFDQRGSGLSKYDISKGLTIEMITSDVYTITQSIKKQANLSRLVLWGGSFGGCLALLCMEKFPSLFEQCILSSPAVTFNRLQALDFFKCMQAPYKKRIDESSISIPTATEDIEPEIIFSNTVLKDFIYSPFNPSNSLKHICAMSSWFYKHSFNLINLCLPTLILQGKEDPVCDYQNIDNAIKQTDNPFIQYYLYEFCGHAVFEDKENEFIKRIINFIGGNR